MRTNIVHQGAESLTYEIRGIVKFAEKLQKLGMSIIWENIGDPIAKGEAVPEWVKQIVQKYTEQNTSFGYSPTKGMLAARQCIANERLRESNVALDPEDILFCNGLGDAISVVYTYLRNTARVIGPSPAYPTHSSAESAHAGFEHITYTLDPRRNWMPDMHELKNKIAYNPAIAGILIINPDNPTGMVYPREVLQEIVSIAREYKLFLIADETYARLTYKSEPMTPLFEVIGTDVPAIIMRGLSKEVPWPGSRCGWMEIYNKQSDPTFARYIQSLYDAKMLEVCATTLPQTALPDIFTDERYRIHISERVQKYEEKADIAYAVFSRMLGIQAPRPNSSFYYTVVFEKPPAPNGKLHIEDKNIREAVEQAVANVPPDKRFVYYLLGATGICVVPLSGFNTTLAGFRMTLLESDIEKFKHTVHTIADAMQKYQNSV